MAKLSYNKREIEIKDGSSVKDAAQELGVPFGCEHGVCGACQIDIVSGKENLSELNETEKDMGKNKEHRLACQCKIMKGNVEIRF